MRKEKARQPLHVGECYPFTETGPSPKPRGESLDSGRFLIKSPSVLSLALDRVHGLVGMEEQSVGVRWINGKDGHPQATGEGHRLSVDLSEAPDRSENPGKGSFQSFLCHVMKDDREFVTSQTGDRIRLTQQGLQSRSDRHKKLVSCLVSQEVVDRLEAVQVKESHGKGGLMANGVATGLFQSIVEEPSVGKSCEGIVE